MKLRAAIFGCQRVYVDGADGPDLLNICMKYGFEYYEMGEDPTGLYIVCPILTAARVSDRCGALGIPCRRGEILGLPATAVRYRRR